MDFKRNICVFKDVSHSSGYFLCGLDAWLNAKTDGPEPEIPQPKAPFSIADFLTDSK
jgi:hypothetical protein